MSSFKAKLLSLFESQTFLGGGVALTLAAFGFELASSAAPIVSILVLVGAWICFTVTFFRHDLFANLSRPFSTILNCILSVGTAIVLAVTWYQLRPTNLPAYIAYQIPSWHSIITRLSANWGLWLTIGS